ncbi:WD40 repeat domain-containing protein [Helicobacter sp. MIT 21-1697]|uniref:WD40 repeat domain-containing protein n=1 Tax=Helicobacter sp. MIT 21-1697 TaxID=2993733 RepID=UPI00224ABCF5|nr:WD40 repeat domain-containing protein [Helicobacter sp. MIT 21-1697]MCX2717545.1 WD40 repeat domain-containing protein [Helicobacter sp. MIT 21-1697]
MDSLQRHIQKLSAQKLLHWLLYSLVLCLPLCAKALVIESKNAQVIHTNGIITHISTFGEHIFVGNAIGQIDVFKLDNTQKAHKIYSLTLPPIEDYFGNTHAPRVFDITTFDGKTLFVLSEASRGTKQILKLSATQSPQVIFNTTAAPKRIIAFGDNKLVIGFLSNEIGLFDMKNAQFVYMTHPSLAGFSDLCVNAPFIFSTDESGSVSVIDSSNGKVLSKLDIINKDNNYQITSARDKILTASVDRQMGIYTFTSNSKAKFTLTNATSIKSAFLIYAVGISPNAIWAAFSKNEQNDIGIIHLATQKEYFTLKGSTSLINSLIFYDENTLISGNDDKTFIIWKLPKSKEQ